ncbi:MAG: YgiT-type zinc finger domain-containing protein [Candidatus Omnitrophota bacterium]|jgi:YgiT-type zinc finger domain-containing protein
MKPFDKCPVCGGELHEKKVEKILRGGDHTAIINTTALVCLHCGERLYDQDIVRNFENIRSKLKAQDTSSFKPIGKSFKI